MALNPPDPTNLLLEKVVKPLERNEIATTNSKGIKVKP
jgi:hypothetical protein